MDDVLNVAGHRIGTMEVESVLVEHHAVAEAAVVGRAHELKGQAIAAFVTLRVGKESSASLRDELRSFVAEKIGAIARPDDVLFTADLPKTRSGKIMRRLLRDIAEGRALGDTTTLADPTVVAGLKEQYESQEGKLPIGAREPRTGARQTGSTVILWMCSVASFLNRSSRGSCSEATERRLRLAQARAEEVDRPRPRRQCPDVRRHAGRRDVLRPRDRHLRPRDGRPGAARGHDRHPGPRGSLGQDLVTPPAAARATPNPSPVATKTAARVCASTTPTRASERSEELSY